MVITNKEILLPLIARSIKTKFDSNCKIPAINKERIIPSLDIIKPPRNKPTKVAPNPYSFDIVAISDLVKPISSIKG